jgi:hypothetical protein
VVEGANPPKSKVFRAVAHLKTGVTELNHPLDQSDQTWCHLRLSPFVVDEWREQMSVHPLRINMHINKEPLLGSAFLAALEGSIDVILSVVATK